MSINKPLLEFNDESYNIINNKKTSCKDKVKHYLYIFTILLIISVNITNLIYLIRINYMINMVIPYAPKIQELVDIACSYVTCSY